MIATATRLAPLPAPSVPRSEASASAIAGARQPLWPEASRPYQGLPACDPGGYGDDGHG
jgi:hypothetical protein